MAHNCDGSTLSEHTAQTALSGIFEHKRPMRTVHPPVPHASLCATPRTFLHHPPYFLSHTMNPLHVFVNNNQSTSPPAPTSAMCLMLPHTPCSPRPQVFVNDEEDRTEECFKVRCRIYR